MPHSARLFTCLFSLLLTLNSGCSSAPKQADTGKRPPGTLETRTLDGDIRLFNYVVTFPELPLRPITELSAERGPGGELNNLEERLTNRLYGVEETLARHPDLKLFCPKGFNVIEKYVVLNELVVRGECKYDS